MTEGKEWRVRQEGKHGGLGWRLRQEGKRGGVACRPANTNHARFPAHTHAPQSAPVMSTDLANSCDHAFPHGASLNTGQKIYCAWAVPSTKSRVFMDGNSSFHLPSTFSPLFMDGN